MENPCLERFCSLRSSRSCADSNLGGFQDWIKPWALTLLQAGGLTQPDLSQTHLSSSFLLPPSPHPGVNPGRELGGTDLHPEDTPGHESLPRGRRGRGDGSTWQVELLLLARALRGRVQGDGGVALGGSGGAGEDGVDDVVDEGLLLESGW